MKAVTVDPDTGRVTSERPINDESELKEGEILRIEDEEGNVRYPGLGPKEPNPLDRAAIPSEQKQAYRDGKAALETARADWTDARQAAAAAKTQLDAASTTQEYVDALEARDDALQDQLDVIATFFNSGVVPAMDVLFRTVMDEEP